jgi:hypothetical protein
MLNVSDAVCNSNSVHEGNNWFLPLISKCIGSITGESLILRWILKAIYNSLDLKVSEWAKILHPHLQSTTCPHYTNHTHTHIYVSYENRENSILLIKESQNKVKTSPSKKHLAKDWKNWKERTTLQPQNKNEKTKNTDLQYEQQWQSLTCSGNINNSMNDSDFSITTSPLTSSAGKRPVKTLTCVPSFCCKSGSNRKTHPCYCLATNSNTRK